MHIADLPKPVAVFHCGELDESYPEAHKAFLEEFLCSIQFVDFVVDADTHLWAFVGDDEAYTWRDDAWVDASLFI